VPCIAVDLPSGLAGGEPEPLGPHIEADVTVTFVTPKVAQIFPPAADAVGELVIADLGVPPALADRAGEDLFLLVGEELAGLVPVRAADSNKGDYGHLLVVAGSVGKAGAAVLAARSAVRAGAGLVTVATPAPLLSSLTAGSVESMTLPLPASSAGQLAADASGVILAELARKTALAIGPGLGQEPAAVEAIRGVVLAAAIPAVIDADALNAFAGNPGALRSRPAPTVLTPHPGELGRLLDMKTADIQADRRAAVRKAVEATGAVVVLKGHLTLVAGPDGGGVHVNPTGNPWMATGGTGDVLTGLIGALLAQGLTALDAARLGVYLHGLAGDLALAERGGHGLAAGDLITAFPAAWAALVAGDGEDEPAHGEGGHGPLRLAHRCGPR
jgi:ADP-dependent NAD(P)H-hydrate dehydratase / NAD(P)H-hydrate epimerase